MTQGLSIVPSVNDVVIKIGTVNGTGSASANGLLMKAIFRMGIPVAVSYTHLTLPTILLV